MEIRIRDTGELLLYSEWKSRHPEISWPDIATAEFLDTIPADPVLVAPAPQPSESQRVSRNGVTQDLLGNWIQAWKLDQIPEEELTIILLAAKNAKNTYINECRLASNRTSFTHAGKEIACDELSRSDIDAIVGSIALFGVFPAGFPNAWKAIDNTYIPLPDVDSFKAMHTSMVNRGNYNFAKAQQLKQLLAAANTIAEVNAIIWDY